MKSNLTKKARMAMMMGISAMAMAAAPALAQDSANPATAANDGTRVEDIVVTAQRRGQNLQDVPIAVTAASGDTLAKLGIRSTSDLGVVAPAVTFATGLGGAAITVRGIGGTGSGSDESANAVYVDGVYMPSPAALLFQFNNIERVEVLKGPQGTLFGRNASGGLIQVITRTPQFDPAGTFEIGYGNYDTVRGSAYFTTGITDRIAIDLAAVGEHQDKGWGTNVTTGDDAYKGYFAGVRAKLLWNLGEDTTITATALYAKNRSANIQGSQILAGERLVTGGGNVGFYNQSENSEGFVRSVDRNYALTIAHDFGGATFTSITSRDLVKFRLVTDADLSPLNLVTVDIHGPTKSWTQEFQLASAKDSPVQWIGGLFYYHSNLVTSPFRTIGLAFAPLTYRQVDARQVTDSYAAYGQATVPVTGTTNVTAGLRYTKDKRTLDVQTSTSVLTAAPTVFPTAKTNSSKLTWRFAVDQKLDDRVLAYASYSRGFKSGLYNSTNPGTPPVEPQSVDAYEIGLKSDLFDRKLRFNASAFHYDLKDIQLRGIVPPNPTPIFYNAASARTDGVELEINAAVARGFSIQGNATYLHGRYGKDFTNALFYSVNTAPASGLTQLPPGNGAGKTTVFTPKLVTSLAAQYRIETETGDVTLSASYTYNDGYWFDPQNRVRNPSYNLVNSSISWEFHKGITIRGWVNNLLKEKYYSVIQPSNFGDYYFPAAPRTYGASLGFRFGG